MTGKIHSIESFGTVDGPGIRLVVFFQGCPLRCLYCHNPDTWDFRSGMEMTSEEILSRYEKNRNFYRNGGITATGGEPLMQLPFLTELFQKARKKGIHTCLDTSGILYRKEKKTEYQKLFEVLDLVLLDIKHSDPERHKALTGKELSPVLAFAGALEEAAIPMVIRHVAVPGLTDTDKELEELGELIGGFKNLKGLEVLPYHTLGLPKYEALGLSYPLKGVPDMSPERARAAGWKVAEIVRAARKK